jgi:PTH1 family peptidyl-tRNA hydrolase
VSPEHDGPGSSDSGPWLIVGLGNPAAEYAGTRHSAGHLVLDELAGRVRGRFSRHARGRADVVETRLGGLAGVGGERAVLARPRSYMNESGGPVASLRDYYKSTPGRIVVVHDELDLPFGSLRCKLGGGDGGHNGLKSIRASLGTGDFLRVRVGIGRPPGRMDAADYVLRPFSPSERKELPLVVAEAADAVESLVTDGLEATQNQFNG